MSLEHFLAKHLALINQPRASNEIATNEIDDDEETPYVQIIDQFEEIFTTQPARWQERKDFFRQLEQAMNDQPLLWVVLTLREDYVTALEPYAHLLTDKMRARFYMQRMDYKAALEAVKKPAELAGCPFAPGVAEKLVNNLRQIRIHGQSGTQLGQFVEPVVCYQLWENLKEQPPDEITRQHLQELGDVDTALAQFYEQAIAEVVRKTGIDEIKLRNWFQEQLITEAGTRGTAYQGQEQTEGLSNEAVFLLENQFIIRVETRAGGRWYELVHDRLVEPILKANESWLKYLLKRQDDILSQYLQEKTLWDRIKDSFESLLGLYIFILIGFLISFFSPNILEKLAGGDIQIMGFSLQSPELKAFLAGGIVFLEFSIILFAMLDRIVDTIREIIRPIAKLLPLVAFLTSTYQTFGPLVKSFLPQSVVGPTGNNPDYITIAVADGSFSRGILLTLGTMLLFLLANRALMSESEEVRALKAELKKARKAR